MRHRQVDLLFVAAVDALIGLAFLTLDSTYFAAPGFRIPKDWLPLHVWGLLYLVLAAGMIALPAAARRWWIALAGVAINAVFALALAVSFQQGWRNPDPRLHTSPVGALLFLGWTVRHGLTGRRLT